VAGSTRRKTKVIQVVFMIEGAAKSLSHIQANQKGIVKYWYTFNSRGLLCFKSHDGYE